MLNRITEILSNRGLNESGTNGVTSTSTSPIQNALVESFNGKFRDECLNQNWFRNLEETIKIIDEYRVGGRLIGSI